MISPEKIPMQKAQWAFRKRESKSIDLSYFLCLDYLQSVVLIIVEKSNVSVSFLDFFTKNKYNIAKPSAKGN